MNYASVMVDWVLKPIFLRMNFVNCDKTEIKAHKILDLKFSAFWFEIDCCHLSMLLCLFFSLFFINLQLSVITFERKALEWGVEGGGRENNTHYCGQVW